jgi:sugar lactone lactonase YvrE
MTPIMPVPLSLGDPVCIMPVGDWCGEGAVWHPHEQALYWTDINRFLIHRWESFSGALATWKFSEPVTALALTTDDSVLLVVLASRIILWRVPVAGEAHDTDGKTIYRLPEWPQARCNDARVDPAGVLWVATMQNNVAADGTSLTVDQAIGRLFSIDAAMQVKTWRSQLFIGNTLAWSPDGRFM